MVIQWQWGYYSTEKLLSPLLYSHRRLMITYIMEVAYSGWNVTYLWLWTPFHFVEYPDSKVHGANMGPNWGRQGPGGPHVAIWVVVWYNSVTK